MPDGGRQPSLAATDRTGHGNQPVLSQQRGHRIDVLLAADQGRTVSWDANNTARSAGRGRRCGKRSVVTQNSLLQRLKVRARAQPKFSIKQLAHPRVGVQGGGRPARLVQPENLIAPEPLHERVLGEDRNQLGDRLLRLANLEQRTNPGLLHGKALLEQTVAVRVEPTVVVHVVVRPAAPQPQRGFGEIEDRGGLEGSDRVADSSRRRVELPRVHRLDRHDEPISLLFRAQQRRGRTCRSARVERAAQSPQQSVEGGGRARRPFATPDRVDQNVGSYLLVEIHQQDRQCRCHAPAVERDR